MATTQNHLIELLPRRERARLLALCEPVQLTLTEVLVEPRRVLRHVYFPIEGFISLLKVVQGSPALEVGMIGSEGMLGAHLLLGVAKAPLRALVQGAGTTWRLGSAVFRAELTASLPLQAVLLRYVHVCMEQLASSAVCVSYHQIGPRLARWLLMTQDRAHSARFHVTQEFLASMLGVRRVGVTAAAGAMQERGLIAYRRGEMQVLDRRGLEAAACSCYANDRGMYDELLRRR
jgi:CRP-like cAMP-binding protein